eukprot:1672-Chlamydomonas_euryale.AAC.1
MARRRRRRRRLAALHWRFASQRQRMLRLATAPALPPKRAWPSRLRPGPAATSGMWGRGPPGTGAC